MQTPVHSHDAHGQPVPATPIKQRLVLCLDGTWNNRDDCTNVYHLHNMVLSGPMSDGWIQRKYYDQGVGTGVNDSVSGGGFGKGLDENVREAVDWLIENYNDGDEFYIFGFSRGAYTARSLVGFLAKCGLLRRGAPLTVNQLWRGYRALGRAEEDLMSAWERIVGAEKPPFRQLSDLRWDDWRGGQLRTVRPALNATEENLLHWSRRIPITYLGIFDTVGAMGVEALAIPGLRSKLAVHHNMRLSSIVRKARHAMAVDEHRSSFARTDMFEFVPNNGHSRNPDAHVDQRWFAGAHSNVGGGYDNNLGSMYSLRWVMDGALAAGLQMESAAVQRIQRDTTPNRPDADTERMAAGIAGSLVDSYSDFAKPFWVHVVRGKRNYRMIAPPPETRGADGDDESTASGFALRSVGNALDEETLKPVSLHGAKDVHVRPNLLEYLRRNGCTQWAEALAARCHHEWEGAKAWGAVSLVLWCVIAAFGARALGIVFGMTSYLPYLPLAVLAAYLTWVDWAESSVNFNLARKPAGGFWTAVRDCLFWLRAGAVVLVFTGLIYMVVVWVHSSWASVVHHVAHAWPVFVGAVVASLPLRFTDAAAARHAVSGFRWRTHWPVVMLMAAIAAGALLALRRAGGWHPVAGHGHAPLAGALFLVVLAFYYYMNSFHWVGEPTDRARLGSILKLQRCISPAMLVDRLNRWRATLTRRWLPGDPDADKEIAPEVLAGRRLGHIICEALWRDMLGFIPVYTGFFVVALWFAETHLHWSSGKLCLWYPGKWHGLAPWLWLPFGVAVADYVEDLIHLRSVRRFARGDQPVTNSLLTCIGTIATATKFAGFTLCLIIAVAAIGKGVRTLSHTSVKDTWWQWLTGDHGGRVGLAAMVLGSAALFSFAVQLTAALRRGHTRVRASTNQDESTAPAGEDPHNLCAK